MGIFKDSNLVISMVDEIRKMTEVRRLVRKLFPYHLSLSSDPVYTLLSQQLVV